ncbi:MAG: carboxypeptidase regulatory-like domain-containing protein [Acidobacteriaceae bacterium]|nr:carboxypeptidase regulatory-like domain-containing protein [Acidobacteriaceae bacterium]
MFDVRYLLLFISLYSFSPLAPAQVQAPVVGQAGTSRTRSIQGVVLSSNGAPVPGAIVLLKNGKTLQVRSYVAQRDGAYHFYGLSTDVNWQLRAEAGGMTSKIKTVSVFDSHPRVQLNLKLDKKKKV